MSLCGLAMLYCTSSDVSFQGLQQGGNAPQGDAVSATSRGSRKASVVNLQFKAALMSSDLY